MMRHILLHIILFFVYGISFSSAQTIAITNGTILTSDMYGTIEGGTIVIRDGVISEVGVGIGIPEDARVVDASGKFLTPGYIASSTTLSTVEINGGAEANDSGTSSLNISAAYDIQYALNPASTLIPVARRGGVTSAIVVPTGLRRISGRETLFSGQAAMVQLGTEDRMLVQPQLGVYMHLGRRGADAVGGGRGASMVAFKMILDDVRLYSEYIEEYEEGRVRDFNMSKPDLDALLPVIEGEIPLVVRVDRAADILILLDFAKNENIRLILEGAAEGWKVAKQIADANVPVILDAYRNLPSNFDMLTPSINNPALLNEAGVTIVIKGETDGHAARLIRYNAGIAVANGLPKDVALKSITVNAARIWGQDHVGQLSKGQRADIVMWSGDPFEPLSNAEMVLINGIEQSLVTRETLLRDKYLPK